MFYVYLTNPVYCVSFFETGQRVTLYQLPTKMSSEQVIKNIEFKTETILLNKATIFIANANGKIFTFLILYTIKVMQTAKDCF